MKAFILSLAVLTTAATLPSPQSFAQDDRYSRFATDPVQPYVRQPQLVQRPEILPVGQPTATFSLNNAQLRDIDRLATDLAQFTTELHDEYHEHLDGVRYAEILDDDVTELERISEDLHQIIRNAPGGDPQATRQIQKFTNDYLQLASRIQRTIDLTEPWLRTSEARLGIYHMRSAAADVNRIVGQIDRFLPVDESIMDDQAHILEGAVKELHDEFHEHLEGYEYSRHTDEDLEELEALVEHMHDLAHGRTFSQMELDHLLADVREVRQSSLHIDGLLVQQSQAGVRTHDWIGIQHSRDAVSDVLASADLLEHMIGKVLQPVGPRHRVRRPDRYLDDHRPMRDRPSRDRFRSRYH